MAIELAVPQVWQRDLVKFLRKGGRPSTISVGFSFEIDIYCTGAYP
jgi:hypothetical protein